MRRFEWPVLMERDEHPFFGLGRIRFRSPWNVPPLTPPPRGWRHLPVEDRNAVYELPLWLYWPIRLWRERYWRVCEPLIRWGVFRVKEEGGYYHEGKFCLPPWLYRLVWCFLNDRDDGRLAPGRSMYWGPPRRRVTRAELDALYARILARRTA